MNEIAIVMKKNEDIYKFVEELREMGYKIPPDFPEMFIKINKQISNVLGVSNSFAFLFFNDFRNFILADVGHLEILAPNIKHNYYIYDGSKNIYDLTGYKGWTPFTYVIGNDVGD